MKYLKRQAEKERKEILTDSTFLEETLYPIADKNATELNEKKTLSAMKRKRKIAALISVPMALVIIATAIVLGVIFGKEDEYITHYQTIYSDIITVNDSLIYTQVGGEFDFVTRTHEVETNKTVSFNLKNDVLTDENYYKSNIEIIVDRNYKSVQTELYINQFSFLGFTIYMNEIKSQDESGEITVYEYIVYAYFDTGAEQYVITYEEISISGICGFNNYLQNLITKKII